MNDTSKRKWILKTNFHGKIFDKEGAFSSSFSTSQSNLTQMQSGSYRLIYTSLATPEKAHLDNSLKRFVGIIGGMKSRAIRAYSSEFNTSYAYFNAELEYLASQNVPSGQAGWPVLCKDINHMNTILNSGQIPIILTIEGMNSFMGEFITKNNRFRKLEHNSNNSDLFVKDLDEIKNEYLANLREFKMKSPYKAFIISPVHHNWDYIAGQSRYFDKDQDGINIRSFVSNYLTTTIAGKLRFNNKMGDGIIDKIYYRKKNGKYVTSYYNKHFKQKYVCKLPPLCNAPVKIGNEYFTDLNTVTTDIGMSIFQELLDAVNGYKNPILIDVKHMDIQARLDYYDLLKHIKKEYGISIPIVNTHTGVSGKSQRLAYHTSVLPLIDSYDELLNPMFYNDISNDFHKIANEYPELLADYNMCKEDMNFLFPLSLNLYNEEIEVIYKSDGLIGVILDERLLGAYTRGYRSQTYNNKVKKYFQNTLPTTSLKSIKEFDEVAPLIRNIVYIVQHSGVKCKDAWNHIAIGSDYDGLVDPVDLAPTSAHLINLKNKVIEYLPHYCKIEDIKLDSLFLRIQGDDCNYTIDQAIQRIFCDNAFEFTLKYYCKNYRNENKN